MDALKTPSISVIFELDNAAFHKEVAWVESINTLLTWIDQSAADTNVIEVFITHNQRYAQAIERYIGQLPLQWKKHISSLSLKDEDAHYYVMKNAGARQARGEIVVFLDCDLTPVHGSFYDLVFPLYKEKQIASTGHTYFPLKTFISKAYSLFWYFPLYRDLQTLGKHQAHASNLALRRDWFLKTRFEVQHGGFKVCCFLLAQRLKKENHTIHHPDVWFKHELWNHTLRFFIWRATVAGRDHDKKFAIKHTTSRRSRLKAAGKSLLTDVKRVYGRHIKYHKLVQLRFSQQLSLFSSAFAFFLFYAQPKQYRHYHP